MTGTATTAQVAPAWVTDFYAAIDALDVDAVMAHLTDDIWARHFSDPPIEGKERYREYAHQFVGRHTKVQHEIRQSWVTDDGTVFVEIQATHTLLDGRSPSVPAMSQLTRRDGKIARIKVFLDKSPFLAG